MAVIPVRQRVRLEDYAAHLELSFATAAVRREAESASRLAGRRIWMINSTAQGGGVAEMLPRMIQLMRCLGLDVRWATIETDEARFFDITKRVHRRLHGVTTEALTTADADLYREVSERSADTLESQVADGDIVVVHDPQPLATGALLRERRAIDLVWRCHIGSDRETSETKSAWRFLEPWLADYKRTVFSVPEYVPPFLSERAEVIPPAIDPLSHKNRHLSVFKLAGILGCASLSVRHQPVLYPAFVHPARRLQADGSWLPAIEPEEIGLLSLPIVTQVSRWDVLKGFLPLMHGFVKLKELESKEGSKRRSRIGLAHLVLAGPEPSAVQDDPGGRAALDELCDAWIRLAPRHQRDIAIVLLPMESQKENALMVNAIQRCSSIIVQNSIREGFGLTVTEAMWKAIPVIGSSAPGIRSQLRDGEEGRLVRDPEDIDNVAQVLREAFDAHHEGMTWGLNGRRRVGEEFLILHQVQRWIALLGKLGGTRCEA